MVSAISGIMAATAAAPNDSTVTDSCKSSKTYVELTLATRNLSRGVVYSKSPSLQMLASYRPCSYFELGTYGQVTSNGVSEGYGNQLNVYVSIKHKAFSLTADDFYYFNSEDNLNHYFDYDANKTQHFIELRAKYDTRFDLTVAYTIYQNSALDNQNPVYIEAGYDLMSNLNIFAAYLTNRSDQMFYEKEGFTSVGVTFSKNILEGCKFPALAKISLVANPNSDNISEFPGVGRSPINLIGAITF